LARTTIIQLTDDIDGSKAAETVRFAVDGRTYEIDLSTEHADSLRHSLAQFVAAARRAGRAGRVDASPRRGQDRQGRPQGGNSSAVRAWARENGVPVSPRGRVPQDVVAQHTRAQQAPVAQPAPAESAAAEPAPAESETAEPVPTEPVPAESADKPKRSRRKRG